MADFEDQLNAILKVQFEDHVAKHDKGDNSVSVKPYLNKNTRQLGTDEYTHYLSIKINSLVPLGQLVENINTVQDEMIGELGSGVVEKTAEGTDLHIKLLAIKESIPNALGVAFRSITSFPIISSPVIEFGGVLAAKEGVSMMLFSETLEQAVNHIDQHCSKTPGLECKKLAGSTTALSQKGLFKLEVLNVCRPEDFKKPSKKARFGKYDWSKLEVVSYSTNSVVCSVNVAV